MLHQWAKQYGQRRCACSAVQWTLAKRAIRLEVRGGITRGVAARTEPNDGKYEKHLRAEPQDWTDGGNFTRHVCRELNRKRDGGLGSRDTRDGTPSSVGEEYLLGGKSTRTGQVAEASAPIQLGANGQKNKNTRIAFGTMNIGAHAKTHMRCTIVSQAFQERGQLFQKMSQPFQESRLLCQESKY